MIGPELGITQPGMTIVCGDSHTSTRGAFGTIASTGIGTRSGNDTGYSVHHAGKPKVMRINVRKASSRCGKRILSCIISKISAVAPQAIL